jgi:acyl dehydratase
MAGRTFAQWQLGERISHPIRHAVTQEENRLLTIMTHNPQPLHLDPDYAATTEFGQIVVNGLLTFALMIGISVTETTLGTLIANLGYDKVAMPHPVFPGDTLRVETEVAALRESKSRPSAGIVTFRHRAFNQKDELVCECLRTALVRRI